MNLKLNLVGTFVNSWPILTIKQGNKRYEYTVKGNTELDIDLADETFTLGMYNKSFGQNHVIRFNGCWKFDIPDGIPLNCIIEMRNRSLDDIEVINHFSDYTIRDKDEQYAMIEKIRDLFR